MSKRQRLYRKMYRQRYKEYRAVGTPKEEAKNKAKAIVDLIFATYDLRSAMEEEGLTKS